MNHPRSLISGRLLLSLVAVFTAVSPFLADWNATHIYNPLWPPHAKFHNAQTMTLGALLGIATLAFTWLGNTKSPRVALVAAAVFAPFTGSVKESHSASQELGGQTRICYHLESP